VATTVEGVVAPTVPFNAPANFVVVNVVPSNVNADESISSPAVVANVTLPEVREDNFKEAPVTIPDNKLSSLFVISCCAMLLTS
jgi:hypothetical protein